MKIILAADHAGFELKEEIKKHLEQKSASSKDGLEILDVGSHELVDGDDYPVYMAQAGLKVAEDMSGETKAIIFGGSGQGEAIAVNRFPGVRAVVWYGDTKNDGKTDVSENADMSIIRLSREHNDANILSIGARFVTSTEAIEAVDMWLATPFSGAEHHTRRNELIDNIE